MCHKSYYVSVYVDTFLREVALYPLNFEIVAPC